MILSLSIEKIFLTEMGTVPQNPENKIRKIKIKQSIPMNKKPFFLIEIFPIKSFV